MNAILVLATVLLNTQPALDEDRAIHLATVFVEEAGDRDPYELAAIAWVETGTTFRSDLVSRAGACGLMQVIPRFQPERPTCRDLLVDDRLSVRIGGAALGRWERYESRACRKNHDPAAHYNSGNRVNRRSLRYARTVRRIANRLRRQAIEARDNFIETMVDRLPLFLFWDPSTGGYDLPVGVQWEPLPIDWGEVFARPRRDR